MDKSFAASDPKLAEYVRETFAPTDPLLDSARKSAARAGLPPIHVGPFDGLHLEVLTRLAGAKKIVEIGTLGGYSGLCLLRGAGAQGKLYTFEIEPKHAQAARQFFDDAGVGKQVEIFVGPALDQLPKIESNGPFDLVFIDADKVSYPNYLKWAARNLRIGGAVLADNTFAFGKIADSTFESQESRQTVDALRVFNWTAANGGQFRSTMIPTGEGLTLCVKVREL